MKPSHIFISISSIITVFCSEGVHLSEDKQVSQTPAEVLTRPNVQVNLSFTHTIQNYDTILWYQRPAGDTGLKLIGYVAYKTPTVESAFKEAFAVSGDGEKAAHLHILGHPEDSTEYYGAATRGQTLYEAYFGSGTKLTVLEPGLNVTGPTVTLLPPSSRECRNQKDQKRKKTIVCVASGFYPDHVSVSWEVNGQKVTDGVATDGAALRPEGKFYRISSRLRVSAEDWFRPDSDFTCIISFFNGTSTELYSASLQGEAAAATEVMSRETYLRITQAAKLSYGVFILKSVVYGAFVIFLAWKLQGWTGKQNL